MLHIKDIEAFARINEALFRTPGTAERGEGERAEGDADLSSHPAVLLARLMAAAQASAEEELRAEAAQPAVEESADTATHTEEPAAAAPMTMAGLFSRMMFGQR